MSLSRKAEKGVSWLKTVMFLWAAFVGFKILFAFGQANTTRVIAEALMMFIGAFFITGIPAFLLGWATGKNEPPIREAAADQGPMQRPPQHDALELTRAETPDNHAYPAVPPEIEEGRLSVQETVAHQHETAIQQEGVINRNGVRYDPVDEDAIYATVAVELESGNTDKGLWTRLFAECEGDEKQTKVIYIKRRVERLMAAECARREQAAIQQSERLRLEAIAKEKDEQLQRRNAVAAEPQLLAAVWNGNLATTRTLLSEGTSPFGSDANGTSLLDLARQRGDQQMVDLLNSFGAGSPVQMPKAGAESIGGSDVWVDTRPLENDDAGVIATVTKVDSGRIIPTNTEDIPIWVWGFVACLVVGAMFFAYQNYTKRQTVAASAVQAPVPQLDLSEFQKAPSSQASTDWNNGVITPPAKPADPLPAADMSQFTSSPPVLKIAPTVVSAYQLAEQRKWETEQRAKDAQIQADLNRIAARAISDYPYLGTPEGKDVADKILKRRDELIQQGNYPSIALTQAVNEFAPAYAPGPVEEKRIAPVEEKHNEFMPGCRWVTPHEWSCK